MSGVPDDDLRAQAAAIRAFEVHQPGLPANGRLCAGEPVRVLRLDRDGSYLLIPLRDAAGLRGVVQLDAVGRSVESVAAVRDPASRFLISGQQALASAQAALPEARDWELPFLGWQPCRESLDPLTPLWVIPHAHGRAFVSQAGQVFVELTLGRGGA